MSRLFPTVRAATFGVWQECWDTRRATSKLGEIKESVVHRWSCTNIRDRRTQTALARLRIGHTHLTHSYLLSGDHQPYCDDCLVPLTVRHLLAECLSLIELRHRFLSRCCGPGGVYDLASILGPDCLNPGYEVLRFVREAGFLSMI